MVIINFLGKGYCSSYESADKSKLFYDSTRRDLETALMFLYQYLD